MNFGVDWRCAAAELKTLGVNLDPAYLAQRERTEADQSRKQIESRQKQKADSDQHWRPYTDPLSACQTYFSAKHHKQSIALRLGLHRPSLPWSVWTLLLLGSVFVFHIAVGLVWLVEQVIPGDGSLLRLYENISTPWAFVLIAVVGIFPGISEELFFRGFMQRRLLHRYSPVTAIGISTILFALLHVTPHGIALASVMGVWLGVVAWRIGSIWPSVACHAFVNSTWNVYQIGRFQWGVPDLPPMWLGVTSGIVLLVAFILACGKLRGMKFTAPFSASAISPAHRLESPS